MSLIYFPSGDDAFYLFQNNLMVLLKSHLDDWGFALPSLQSLQTAQAAYTQAYAIAFSPDHSSLESVKWHRRCRTDYERRIGDFAALHIINNERVRTIHRVMMGINTELAQALNSRDFIKTSPEVLLTLWQGAQVLIECRKPETSIASMHTDADGIEIRYQIGQEAPLWPEQCAHEHISVRTRFTLSYGWDSSGQTLYLFARWVNLTCPYKNGPWSDLYKYLCD